MRFAFLRSPVGIVIGDIVTLFGIVAGVVTFPFSKIWMGLLFIVVGVFFVVAISVIVMTYLFFIFGFVRALIDFGRRLLFGADQSQMTSNSSIQQKDLQCRGINAELWDR